MATTIRLAITVQKTLFAQVERLAQQFNISRSELFSLAAAQFIQQYPDPAGLTELNQPVGQPNGWPPLVTPSQKTIQQGDIYWVPLAATNEAELGHTHPHVVIQDNVLNQSRVNTVVVCALSTNMKRAKAPGNVLLELGEANLPKQSVVVVSQVASVDKTQLGEYIGSLAQPRVEQVLAGMRFLQLMTARSQ